MQTKDLVKLRRDLTIETKFKNRGFIFKTTWGLFSPREIDEGTKLLINQLDIKPEDLTLDIGCGYGALGLTIASLANKGQVHMVDKDFSAIEYAKKNAKINGLTNCEIYLSNAFSKVPEIKFDNIVSNLPAKVGNELLYIIMQDAKAHLKKGGRFYVVVISGLKEYIKRNFNEIFGNYKKLKQGKTYLVAVAIKE